MAKSIKFLNQSSLLQMISAVFPVMGEGKSSFFSIETDGPTIAVTASDGHHLGHYISSHSDLTWSKRRICLRPEEALNLLDMANKGPIDYLTIAGSVLIVGNGTQQVSLSGDTELAPNYRDFVIEETREICLDRQKTLAFSRVAYPMLYEGWLKTDLAPLSSELPLVTFVMNGQETGTPSFTVESNLKSAPNLSLGTYNPELYPPAYFFTERVSLHSQYLFNALNAFKSACCWVSFGSLPTRWRPIMVTGCDSSDAGLTYLIMKFV